MTDSVHSAPPDAVSKKKKKRSIAARIFRGIAYAITGIFVLLALVVVFVQTPWFRSILKGVIVDAAAGALNATLEIDELHGGILDGWQLDGVRLTNSDGSIASIRRIVLRYDIWKAPWKSVTVKELAIIDPEIRITRGMSKDWNIAHLIRDTTESTGGGTFDWTINVDRIRIVNGRVLVYDSTTTRTPSTFSATHLAIDSLGIDISAAIGPKNKSISIRDIRYADRLDGMSLRRLTGDVLIGERSAQVWNLAVTTDRSQIRLSARIDSIDVLKKFPEGRIETSPMEVSLQAPVVDLRDLQYYLPALNILGSTAKLDLDAAGTLKDLRVRDLNLVTGNSVIALTGRLRNIPDGANMHIEAALKNSRVDPVDLPRALPGVPLPDYTAVGVMEIRSMKFTGKPLKFAGELDVETAAGAARGGATLDVSGPELVYDATVQSRRVNLAPILRNPALVSSINGSVHVEGRGVRPHTLRTHVDVALDTTRFQRWRVGRAELHADALSDSLRMDLSVRSGAGNVTARSMLTFTRDSVDAFAVNSVFDNIDLGSILGNDSLHSDLSAVVSASGNGIDLATASIDARVNLAAGELAGTHIPADTMVLHLDQHEGNARALTLTSGYGDVHVLGRFDIGRFVDWISIQSDSIRSGATAFNLHAPEAVAIAAPVTGRHAKRSPLMRAIVPRVNIVDTTAFMNAQVAVNVREFERIRRLVPHLLLFRGGYRGTIRGGFANMALRGDLQVSDVYYIDTTRRITLLGAGLYFQHSIDSLSPSRPISSTVARMTFNAGDAQLNGMKFNRVATSIGLENSALTFQVKGRLDTSLVVALRGEGRIRSHVYDVRIPVFDVAYRGQAWSAAEPVAFLMDSTGIDVRSFLLAKGVSRLRISGTKRFDGGNAINVMIDSMMLPDAEAMFTEGKTPPKGKGFTGTAEINAEISGTDTAPRLAMDVFIPNLGYQAIQIGELSAEARYEADNLELFSNLALKLKDGEKKKIFFLSGTLPVHMGKAREEQPAVVKQADLRLQMKQFPLFLVEKFVGVFNPLNGEANADLSVTGQLPDLTYSGYLDMHDAVGKLAYNNMTYHLDLHLRPEQRSIFIDTLRIRNEGADWNEGAITGTGVIETNGFAIAHFETTLHGKLKVLKRASRTVSRTVYGDLNVALGQEGLKLTGGSGRSSFAGDMIIEKGDLVFALENETKVAAENANITYVVVDDTTRRKTSSLGSATLSGEGSLFGRETEAEADTGNVRATGLLGSTLSYDLRVSTTGNLGVSMPFSSISQEELNAKLRIDEFRISNASGYGAFTGNVMLTGDSYLMFLSKRFAASGSLGFTGNPTNPDLDLRAVYYNYYTPKESSVRRKVYVIVNIRGTKDKPELKFDLRWDTVDGESIGSGGDQQSDAFSFVLFGSFTGDLSGSDRGKVLDQAQNLSNALTSSMVSAAASEFITRVGLQDVIKRVDIGGIGTQAARIKVPIEIGRFVLIYDGQINSPGNSELVLEIPLGYGFIMATTFRNSTTTTEASTEPQGPTTYEVKVLYRISF